MNTRITLYEDEIIQAIIALDIRRDNVEDEHALKAIVSALYKLRTAQKRIYDLGNTVPSGARAE